MWGLENQGSISCRNGNVASAHCVVPGTTSRHVPVCPCVFPVWAQGLGYGRWLRPQSQALPSPTSMDLLLWVGSVGPFLLFEPLLYSQEQPGPSQQRFHHWEKRLEPRVGCVCSFRKLPGVCGGNLSRSPSLCPQRPRVSSRHLCLLSTCQRCVCVDFIF